MAELVTGHGGSNHVGADDIVDLLKGVLGDINAVDKSANTSITPSMNITLPKMGIYWLKDNVGHVKLNGSESVNLTNTSLGKYRRDLICIKYTVTNSIEAASVEVLQGTAADTEALATRPAFSNNTTPKYLALYEVVVNYNTAISCKFLLDVLEPLTEKFGGYQESTGPSGNTGNDSNELIPSSGLSSSGALAIAKGGTGVTTLQALKQILGITNSGITILQQGDYATCFRLEGLGLKVLLIKQSLAYQANSVITYHTTYGQSFSEIPMVFIQALTSAPAKRSASAGNRTKTSCDIYVEDTTGKSAEGNFCILIIGRG